MKAITLRNVPREIARFIEKRAAETGLSINKTVITLLEQCAGPGRPSSRHVEHHDLDWFAGSWTQKQASELDSALARERVVDPEDWK